MLPLFETGGLRLGESQAILRHLERVHGPSKDEERAVELDVAQEAIAEAQEDLWQFAWRESYYEHLESYAAETLRPRLGSLTAWFARRGGGTASWFGDAFSHVDCVAFTYLDEIDAFFPAVLAEFGELSDLRSRVAALPGVSDYLGSAMRSAVFGMGCTGPKVDPRVALEPGGTFFSPWSEPLDLGSVARSQRRLTS